MQNIPSEQFDLLDHLIFNENALFFKKEKQIPKKRIKELFQSVSSNKIGRSFQKIKELRQIDNQTIYFSLVLYKYEKKPPFLDEYHSKWKEESHAYLLIVEYDDYCIVVKRNANLTPYFKRIFLSSIDYEVLSKLFLSERTEYHALSLLNIDPSEYSTRTKSFRSNDLKRSMSPFGIHRYIMNRMSVSDGSDIVSLTFNTSRINKAGGKIYMDSLFKGFISTANKIKSFASQIAYVDSFALPMKFENHVNEIEPIGVLFLLGELQELIESGQVIQVNYVEEVEDDEDRVRVIPSRVFLRFLRRNNSLLPLGECLQNVNDIPRSYPIENNFDENATLTIYGKSISIRSTVLKNIKLRFENGGIENLLSWFRRKRLFLTNFSSPELVYFSGKLFSDSRLLGAIENLKEVFIANDELENVSSEKGVFTPASTNFSDGSIFNFIEAELMNDDTEYLFCDDLGDEWADYIGLHSDRICLYHAKYKTTTGLSASALQDVIGQAQKNLGNVVPDFQRLQNKINSWDAVYKMDKVVTQIHKMRIGNTVAEGIESYQKKLSSPSVHIEIYLVLNFISKSQLFENLEALRDGGQVQQKAQVIQMLWFISSYVNSCKEIGLKPFIICQP